jgi:hypothetical protein
MVFPVQREPGAFTFPLLAKLFAPVRVGSPQGQGQLWGSMMVGRAYLSRQVVALLTFARETNNPELSALLVHKAARLKSRADEITSPQDIGPKAPDVEPDPTFRGN